MNLVLRARDLGRGVSVRRWTSTAIECYKRGCVCNGCFYHEFFKGSNQRCQMKSTVLELVRVLGTPNNVDAPDQVDESEMILQD